MSKRRQGPLRKLVELKVIGQGRDKWLLECGHEIWIDDSTMYAARCWCCKKAEKTESEIEKLRSD